MAHLKKQTYVQMGFKTILKHKTVFNKQGQKERRVLPSANYRQTREILVDRDVQQQIILT